MTSRVGKRGREKKKRKKKKEKRKKKKGERFQDTTKISFQS